MSDPTAVFYQGSSFEFAGKIDIIDTTTNLPVGNLTGWVPYCDLCRSDGTLVAVLSVIWVNAAEGLARVITTVDTLTWPIETLRMDLLLVGPTGQRVYTKPSLVKIVPTTTRSGRNV